MAKEKEQEQEQQAQQPAAEATSTVSDVSPSNTTATVPAGSPAGTESPVILRANTREDLDQQFQKLKAKRDGKTLTAGAVARSKDDGTYILRVDII